MRWKVSWVLGALVFSSCAGDAFEGEEAGGGSSTGGDAGAAGEGIDSGGTSGSGVGGASRGGQGGTSGDAGDGGSAGEGSGGSDSSGGSGALGGGGSGAGSGGQGGSAGSGRGGGAGSGGGGDRPVFIELVAAGYVASAAWATSGDGTYVAGQATLMGGHIDAIRWTNEAAEVLATVAWTGTSAKGISDDGSIVVGSQDTPVGSRAFRWQGSMTELPPLVRGTDFSQALGLSGDGSIAIGVSSTMTGDTVPVQWMGGGVQQLPLLDGHGTATPTDADFDAGVVGGTGLVTASSESEAVRWPASGVASLGIKRSEVFAVSSDGRYAVGGWVETVMLGPLYRTAFRWSAGGVDDLPPSAEGDVDCLAYAVSGDGAIVAGNCTEVSTATQHWFLWSEATGIVSLDQVLLELDVDTSRYGGFTVTDISSDGSAIIGNTSRNGVSMGYRAIIDGVLP